MSIEGDGYYPTEEDFKPRNLEQEEGEQRLAEITGGGSSNDKASSDPRAEIIGESAAQTLDILKESGKIARELRQGAPLPGSPDYLSRQFIVESAFGIRHR